MDIRNWGIDKIMQLPDSMFGRRWPIMFADNIDTTVRSFYISEIALPEMFVIWEVFGWVPAIGGVIPTPLNIFFSFKLGDQLPTELTYGAMEPLFRGVNNIIIGERAFLPFSGVLHLRQPVQSSGRRICFRAYNAMAGSMNFQTGIVISSVPTEVPDWFLFR